MYTHHTMMEWWMHKLKKKGWAGKPVNRRMQFAADTPDRRCELCNVRTLCTQTANELKVLFAPCSWTSHEIANISKWQICDVNQNDK